MRPMEPVQIERDRYLTIAHDGRIEAVAEERPAATGDFIDWSDRLVLPGLVNAHTHLELSHQRPPAGTPEHLATWLLSVVPKAGGPSPAEAAAEGARQSLAFGVTTVGDISAHPAATRSAVAATGLHGVSFGELRAMAGRRGRLPGQLTEARSAASPPLAAGVSPHAPYSAEPEVFAVAIETGLPVAAHVAETPEESEFLREQAGPFRELWSTIGGWTDDVPTFDGSPVAFAERAGLLSATQPVVLAHVNYLEPGDLDRLARGQASVAYCPRTHAYFGHSPHPFREMLGRGINVCLATDSRASSPDLDLVQELSHVRRACPDLPATDLWAMATWRPAAALGLSADAGTIAPGRLGHLLAFADPGSDDPLGLLLDDPPATRDVLLAGRDALA